MKVFVSVGATSNEEQELFVRAVEDRLRSEGLIPQTVGRNTFSSDAPLKAIKDLMDNCDGVIVIALERIYCPDGLEKRNGEKQKEIKELKISTPWNQIEAALGYSRELPIMVLVENGLRCDGLLEPGNDWYVQTITLESNSINTPQFNGILADWKNKLKKQDKASATSENPAELTIIEMFGGLKITQAWAALGALAIAIGGSFALGAQLFGK